MNIPVELKKFALNLQNGTAQDALIRQLESIRLGLESISTIDLGGEQERSNLDSHAGMALGTTWAASCLEDSVRTIQFVSGILQAIDEKLANTDRALHILYAGTGPYATLMLPALAGYTSDQIQCTLLEYNPESFRYMKKVIHDLGLESRVPSFVNADATSFEPKRGIDILISETMQAGLMVETQVPIALHLSQFLHSDGVMIPEAITVSAGLTSKIENTGKEGYSQLQPLLELNKRFCDDTEMPSGGNPLITQTCVFEPNEYYPRLTLFTRIAVFGKYYIDDYLSGLTIPLILHEFRTFEKVEVHFRYELEPKTGFRFEIR
ncbi:MAG: hypothetical protein Crog4KO_28760 [Crocinitomicaceae bacterium]